MNWNGNREGGCRGSTMKTESNLTRLYRWFIPEPNSGCWLWFGSTGHNGYGRLWENTENRLRAAHRISYEFFIGPVPDGLVLDHLCRVRCCVNPAHLEPVTNEENIRRGQAGSNMSGKTHCRQGHPYDHLNTRFKRRPNGDRFRVCRICVNAQLSASRNERRQIQF